VFVNAFFRCLLLLPVGALCAVLFLSVIGIPFGFVIGMAAGAWITAPIRRHPLFNVKGDAE
jgi:hypothetical protein